MAVWLGERGTVEVVLNNQTSEFSENSEVFGWNQNGTVFIRSPVLLSSCHSEGAIRPKSLGLQRQRPFAGAHIVPTKSRHNRGERSFSPKFDIDVNRIRINNFRCRARSPHNAISFRRGANRHAD
jgi:hypothetical protein